MIATVTRQRKPLNELVTLSEFFDLHYRPTVLVGCQPRTLEEYQRVLRRWVELTGDTPLGEITNLTVACFYEALLELPNKQGGTLSANTVRKHARHLQPILDAAGPPTRGRRDAAGILTQPPWARPPRGTDDIRPAMSLEEVSAMYAVADQAVYPYDERTLVKTGDWWRGALVVAWNTGLRIGTMLKLQDSHVDWKGRSIHVPSSITKTLHGQTKPIGDLVIKHLMLLRGGKQGLLAFPHRIVRMYHEFHRLRALAGLPERPGMAWHSIRSAHATALARKSLSAAQISLGHESVKTTLKSYIQPEIVREAIDALPQPAAFLEGPVGGPQQLSMF